MLLIEEANSPLSTSEGISSRKGPPGKKPYWWAFAFVCGQQHQGLMWSPIPFMTMLMTLS